MARMRREKFGWLRSAYFSHSLPEFDSRPWVVASIRGDENPQLVRFTFVLPAERKKDPYIRTSPDRLKDELSICGLHVTEHENTGHPNPCVGDHDLRKSLRTMS